MKKEVGGGRQSAVLLKKMKESSGLRFCFYGIFLWSFFSPKYLTSFFFFLVCVCVCGGDILFLCLSCKFRCMFDWGGIRDTIVRIRLLIQARVGIAKQKLKENFKGWVGKFWEKAHWRWIVMGKSVFLLLIQIQMSGGVCCGGGGWCQQYDWVGQNGV